MSSRRVNFKNSYSIVMSATTLSRNLDWLKWEQRPGCENIPFFIESKRDFHSTFNKVQIGLPLSKALCQSTGSHKTTSEHPAAL